MKIKKIATWIFALVLTFSQVTNIAFAHEVYEDGKGNGARLVMKTLNSEGLPYLIVYENVAVSSNSDLQVYKDNYKTAVASWTDRSIRGKHITASFPTSSTSANVKIYSYSAAYSNYGITLTALGSAIIYDTNNNRISSYSTASSSTGIISKTLIVLNYDISVFKAGTSGATLTNRVQKTITHEIGHAMGLGHPDRSTYSPIGDTVYSVMRQGFPGEYVNAIPAAHDTNDMAKKYLNGETL